MASPTMGSPSEPSSSAMALPNDFVSVADIHSKTALIGKLVNVMGFVVDFRPPIQTRGKDWKCTLKIIDSSFETLEIIIFWPVESMPKGLTSGDLVLIRKLKVQMFQGLVSGLSNHISKFEVYPQKRSSILQPTVFSNNGPVKSTNPHPTEMAYIKYMFAEIADLAGIPSTAEFEEMTIKAMNIKDKFRLLKDVKNESFHDIIGEVVQVFENAGRVTLYLTDFTSHPLFYNHSLADTEGFKDGRDGDEYGYTNRKTIKTKDKEKEWPGPYGPMTLQITVYDHHASFISENVKAGNWLMLRNVQFKIGRDGNRLEGFLRGDQNAYYGNQLRVSIMEQSEDPDENDERWKDAVRRKRDYWAKFKQQTSKLLSEVNGDDAASKRKPNEGDLAGKLNSKKRRKMRKAASKASIEEKAQSVPEIEIALNKKIRCNHPNIHPLPISTILTTNQIAVAIAATITDPGSGGSSSDRATTSFVPPFVLGKYRANVRVVDHRPADVRDFAVARRKSEMDMLSDYSGGEETDDEADMRIFRAGKGFGSIRVWQWRFALKLEDAGSMKEGEEEGSRKSLWAVVGNEDAQMLLGLDAVNLRTSPKDLTALRQRLSQLWGDEEQLAATREKELPAPPTTTAASCASSPVPSARAPRPLRRRNLAAMPPNSSDEEDNTDSNEAPRSGRQGRHALDGRDPNAGSSAKDTDGQTGDAKEGSGEATGKGKESEVGAVKGKRTNEAFTCCLRQYGIKVYTEDEDQMNAGEGLRWKRMFGLFGTAIA